MKTITIADLERAILAIKDENDLRRVINAVREVQSARSETAVDAIKRGDKVRFTLRSGLAITGIVMKKNRKTVSLRNCVYERSQQPCVDYRVSATLCTVVK